MEDKQIVQKIMNGGNTRLFTPVVQRYSGMMLSKALTITRNRDRAAEAVQMAFTKAYANLDAWRGDTLGPWLMTITMHTALNMMEKERRYNRYSTEAQPLENVADETYSDEHEVRLQRMEQALQQLSPDDRQLISLHYFKKMKTDEMATAMGMTQSNVLVRLHRVRDRLKKIMNHGEE
ncbi:MAG: sigma-70 family RNA polymerase sigma factor [Prevotella sp.]|nr:sigma-70 family RNA polymerase sigma factor [Prevotella sp.]